MNKELLKYSIARAGLTPQSLAEVLGLSRQSFYNRLSGKVEFTLGEIKKIAEKCQLTRDEINDIFFAKL